jgi:hypothetical protein
VFPPAQLDVAAAGPLQPRENPKQGALAAAAGTDNRHELTTLHAEIDVVQCNDIAPVFRAEGLVQPVKPKRWRRFGRRN